MAVTFDGDTLTVTLESGVTEVDVRIDLYREWKLWQLAGNMRYPQLFRVVGGDPLSAVINAGSYFFIQNQSGWRVKPPEEDITIYLTGNLVPENTSLDTLIPTTGAFTAAVLGLQPITQGVTPAMAAQLEHAAFNGGVTIDPANPFAISGTEYPAGTPNSPCLIMADADTIADERGFTTFFIGSDLSLTSLDFSNGHIFKGDNAVAVTLTVGTGANVTNCEFRNLTVTGILDGNNIIRECSVLALNYVQGFMFECAISDKITLAPNSQATVMNCFSNVAGGGAGQTAEIDCGGSGSLALRNYSGGVNLSNYTGGGALSLDMESGRVVVESTVTVPEDVFIRGVADVVDNSGGTESINDLTINKSIRDTGTNVEEMHKLDGLNPLTPMTVTQTTRIVDDISLLITGDGTTSTTVTRGVAPDPSNVVDENGDFLVDENGNFVVG